VRKSYAYHLCLASLFVALDILLTRFLTIQIAPGNHFGFQFLAYGLAGWIIGPYWAIGSAVAGDILGMLANSGGYMFSPLFLLIAAYKGFIFGIMLYRKKPNLLLAAITVFLAVVCIDMTLGSYALSQILGTSWLNHFLMKLPFRVASYPVYVLLLHTAMTALDKTRKQYESR
jgi:ECF transporter S component (folate family)